MHEVWRGRFFMVPFLHLGATRRAVFPDTGRDVSFSVENYAFIDPLGRETLTWARQFEFAQPRRFDETLIFDEGRGCLVVYMGSHQHLAVELAATVGSDGSLIFRTRAQRLYEWRVGFRFPGIFSGVAVARESYSDERSRFEIDVRIANRIWGPILGYSGWFCGEVGACSEIPEIAKPVRYERRS
jgi:hypothetical protein